MEEAKSCPHCGNAREKHRENTEKRALINRLSRVEGQLRGIRAMVERDAYCPDILTQAAAASAALNAFSRELLANHIRTCVVEDIQAGKGETVEELLDILQRFMK